MEIKTSESYQKKILEKYKKEKGGEMNSFLMEPTTRQIREACMYLLEKRSSKDDNYILNRFFQFKNEENKWREIQNFDANKFRPIVNFLKNKAKKTSPENIELISWLIDFKPRPLQEYLKSNFSDIDQNEFIENKKSIDYKRELIGSKNEEIGKENQKKIKTFIILITIAFTAVFLIVIAPKIKILGAITMKEDNKCMTWAKTHYEKVLCTKKFNTKTEPIDPIRLANFKKVEVSMATSFFNEDTNQPLLWYYKNKKGEIEYFTAPGLHPVHGETLKKITETIINKYVPEHTFKETSFLKEAN
ncbi:hypothetical protein [Maribacter sp.]|uniref:hypothetical protein n=1 Tax=Maribacter sp. TaxID=1897614 RepID=UPI0025BE7095|nr:hypothetical protein [Maribacter sp.]